MLLAKTCLKFFIGTFCITAETQNIWEKQRSLCGLTLTPVHPVACSSADLLHATEAKKHRFAVEVNKSLPAFVKE